MVLDEESLRRSQGNRVPNTAFLPEAVLWS